MGRPDGIGLELRDAGITKIQTNELGRRDVTTMAALAATPIPLSWKPDRGAVHSYERVREQARIQVEGRALARVIDASAGLLQVPVQL